MDDGTNDNGVRREAAPSFLEILERAYRIEAQRRAHERLEVRRRSGVYRLRFETLDKN